jgi:4-diphosphocytidyl-2-C-methyl-D-erythritol kinase
MNVQGRMEVNAPSKINVHLKVKSRRTDGYHDLESIFLALAFGDILRFELTEDKNACEVLMNWKPLHEAGIFPEEARFLSAENNSVYQAAFCFRKRTGFNQGIRVYVEKRIPLGAGLGGGSSDAAATLKALNVLAGADLDSRTLQEMAESLGSDVPFFLSGGAAWVSGRGERIVPIAPPQDVSVALVYPGFQSNTKEAFRLLDEIRASEEYADAENPAPIQALSEHPGKWTYKNDFLPVFLAAGNQEVAEAYRRVLSDLSKAGADFTGLSGSGSTCFGIFADGRIAKKAVQAVAGERKKNFVQVTFPLARFAKEVLE